MSGYVHILRDVAWYKTPPWATHERLTDCAPDQVVYPECCCCKRRADETVTVIRQSPDDPDHGARHPHIRFLKPHPKWDANREPRDWWMSYYDPQALIYCGPGLGCNANPRQRRGADLRRTCVFG